MTGIQLRNQVIFDEDDGVHTASLGVITRVWDNGLYVSLRSDGRIFTRVIEHVHPCDHRGHEYENVAGWPPDYVCHDCSDPDNDIYVRWFIYDEAVAGV